MIDPETGLNGIRDVGIEGDRIVAVCEERLLGADFTPGRTALRSFGADRVWHGKG